MRQRCILLVPILAYSRAIIDELCLCSHVIGFIEDTANMEIISAMFCLIAFYFSTDVLSSVADFGG